MLFWKFMEMSRYGGAKLRRCYFNCWPVLICCEEGRNG